MSTSTALHPGVATQHAIHDAVRRDLRRLAAALADETSGTPSTVVRMSWGELAGQLHHHHAFEDASVWPLMGERLGAPVRSLLAENEQQHRAMAAAMEHFDAVVSAPAPDAAATRSALASMTSVVEDHLASEEAHVLPLVPEAFTAEDVAGFAAESAKANPPEVFLPWVLDGADGDGAAQLIASLPAPVRDALESRWIPSRRMRLDAPALTGRLGAVAALDLAYARAAVVVADLAPTDLDAATRCGGWDVRAVLDHLLGTVRMFTLANQGVAVGEDTGALVRDDPATALAEAATASLASWCEPSAFAGDRTFPFGTFPATAAALINLSEVVVHTWDIAVALGRDATVDPAIGEMLHDFYRAIPLDEYRAHGAFGPEVTAAPDASSAEQLLALLGRRPASSSSQVGA